MIIHADNRVNSCAQAHWLICLLELVSNPSLVMKQWKSPPGIVLPTASILLYLVDIMSPLLTLFALASRRWCLYLENCTTTLLRKENPGA